LSNTELQFVIMTEIVAYKILRFTSDLNMKTKFSSISKAVHETLAEKYLAMIFRTSHILSFQYFLSS
jgi:hypothetical protein